MRHWLNLLLNRVSMYRLLSILLTGMAITSFALSLVGALPQQPLALLVSATVLLLASYLSNLLFSRLFAVRAHSESSYITAFILFFLFSPSFEYTHVIALALVAIIASGSKYVLALRGRHIFNPAAIAAVIASLLGIAYASWWVATPPLLPVTVLSAFLILYKTRRFTLAAVFLGIAVPLILISSVLTGLTAEAAIAVLPSWPLLFFAGIMLIEPLTLPPRHRQQYLVAAIVALLFALPVHIGTFASTPAWALVIGNVIAYVFTQRRSILLTFKGSEQLTPSSWEYHFKPVRPISFTAGQYMEITIPHAPKDGRGVRRSFSIIAAPGDTDIHFGIKMYDKSSSFKTALRSLHKGTVIHATSIGGDFVLPIREDIPLLFIAGGIGITPFISHLLWLKKQGEKRDIILIYAVSTIDDIAYANTLKEAGIQVIVIARSNKPMPAPTWQHVNARYLTMQTLIDNVPDIPLRTAYISGPPEMVDAARHLLKQLGVQRVVCDYFTGY